MRDGGLAYATIRRTTEPTSLPVSTQEVVDWLGLSETTTQVTMVLKAAVRMTERSCGRAWCTQSWTMSLDRWPGGASDWWTAFHGTSGRDYYLTLPYAPLASVTSIKTYDTDDTETSITVDDYFLTDTYTLPGRLVLRSGVTWPVDTRVGARARIEWVAGYGDAADVPDDARLGILTLAAYLFEHRGDAGVEADPIFASGAWGSLQSLWVPHF